MEKTVEERLADLAAYVLNLLDRVTEIERAISTKDEMEPEESTVSEIDIQTVYRKLNRLELETLSKRISRLERVIEALAFHEEMVREERSRWRVASDELVKFTGSRIDLAE